MQRENIFFENHAPPCSMPPKLVYYVRVWGRNARPTQDMGMSPQENTMNYATIKYCDIANGEGVRTSLFVSGCRRHCPNCFNAVAWDFGYGAPSVSYTHLTLPTIA